MRTDRRQFVKTALATSVACRLTDPRRALADSLASSNDVIQQARQVALSILKPSDGEIARGLELHSQSLVFDGYGFAPRAAIDGQAYQQAALGGASDAELVDLREDMSMTRYATDELERREFFGAFQASGVTCIFQNAGEEGNDPLRLLKRLSRFTFATDLLSPQCSKAIDPEHVVAAKRAGRLCLAFTTNGVPLRQQWVNTRDELRDVRLFNQLGVQMMHLTYNRRNPLGDGCGEANDGGLSDFGRVAIKELNRQGVIVDVAHSGWRTSLEAAKASSKPMVASHTACAALHKHYRCKPDEIIQAICDTGGLIGICCIPKFLGAAGDIRAFLDHLDYAIKKFGADHVSIGTDVSYQSRNDKAERAKVGKRPDGRSALAVSGPRWGHLWPDFKFRPSEDAVQSLAWTNWPVFTVGLVQRGHSDETVRKVLGENVLRVWRANRTAV